LPEISDEAYPVTVVLTDRRRLPGVIERGHVLAVSIAGFALDVERVSSSQVEPVPRGHPLPDGGWIGPLGGTDDPGGCVDLRARVMDVRQRENPVTGAQVTRIEVDLPGRPLHLFTSPWQLAKDGLPNPQVGSFVEGTFLLTGRIAGGLASPTEKLGRRFG
jgi:hypothetical protein